MKYHTGMKHHLSHRVGKRQPARVAAQRLLRFSATAPVLAGISLCRRDGGFISLRETLRLCLLSSLLSLLRLL